MNDYLNVLHHAEQDAQASTPAPDTGPEHMADEFMNKHGNTEKALSSFAALVTALTFAGSASAQALTPPAADLIKKELSAFYYSGKDMSARVLMRLINSQGNVRERNMTMLRTNKGEGGDQRYLMVFDTPADVKGMSFLISKFAKGDDDRWMYLPGLKVVKRIAADDKKSSFVGSDFTYEDVSGRDIEEEKHTYVRADTVAGRPVHVVESRPVGTADYAMRSVWIDQERFLPLKEEYVNAQGKALRSFTADKVEEVGGRWTITTRTMKNHQTGHRTEVVFKDVKYDTGLSDDVFTERNMKNPVLGAKG
ncbi:MAG: outer membrane lipoprotein-sorting protein [Telluria sp.]